MQTKIGLLVGTNRTGSMTLKMAEYYKKCFEKRNIDAQIINLEGLPPDFAFGALYHNKGKDEIFAQFQAELDGLDKLFILAPEYNGSFPGVLKTFIDGLRYPDSFLNKKVALVGLSSGMTGNAIGLSHLNDILSYMGANVLGLRVKLGEISRYFDGASLTHAVYQKFIDDQIDKLLTF